MSRPMRRRNNTAVREKEPMTSASLKKLYDIGPYHRNEVSPSQINKVRDLIDELGFPRAAEKIGLSLEPLLKITSGFGHKLRPSTAAKIRKYFGG